MNTGEWVEILNKEDTGTIPNQQSFYFPVKSGFPS